MKKMLINGSELTNDKVYGVQRYTLEVLKAMDALLEDGDDVTVLVARTLKADLMLRRIKVAKEYEGRKQIELTRYCKRHGMKLIDPMLTMPILFPASVVFLYDCIVEMHPENAKTAVEKLRRLYYMLKVRLATARADRIITISEYSKKRILEYYPVPADKITVLYTGWQHTLRIPEDRSGLEKFDFLKKGQYYFSLGSGFKHKNIAWILEVAKKHPEETFAISGDNRLSQEAQDLAAGAGNNVHFLGYLNDGQVKALIKDCKALIHPSLEEGFGIPPLEALSVGAQVIVSNASCLPEIYQDCVHYIDPHSTDVDFDRLLSQPVAPPDKLFEKYDWNKIAAGLLAIMRTI